MTSSSSIEIRRHSAESPWTYRDLDRRQRAIADRIHGGGPGAYLFSEVAPVITLGRRSGPCDLLAPRAELAAKGIDVYQIDRGGFATYHGPGQWVLFAVESLERLTGDRRGVRKAVEGLLEVALQVGREYEPRSEIRDGAQTGVWTPRGKFAAVGVHIERGVLLHGLSVNAFRTPTSFYGLKPCGLDLAVDYLFESTGVSRVSQDAAFKELRVKLFKAVFRIFPSH